MADSFNSASPIPHP